MRRVEPKGRAGGGRRLVLLEGSREKKGDLDSFARPKMAFSSLLVRLLLQ